VSKRLQSCCTRGFSEEELEGYAGQIEEWDALDDETREEETCDKLLVEDGLWDVVEDARDLQQGILWREGGKASQPYGWWVRTRTMAGFLAEQDIQASRADSKGSGRSELDDLAAQLGL